ncbi:F-box protein CPR1-like [Solanum stenotomum]|uniref:F-box protein CPR1-like n=1 Tax=Solanum stenotomum TaxID=172797 RepID=UPI0020D0D687|nr:F-box protein CPR1-like [Solanum stenotomum]
MMDGTTKKLSQDVAIVILLRLSVKCLLRYKCVSKEYYTLIQSSTFMGLHFNRISTLKYELVLLKHSFKEDIEQYKTILSFLSDDGNDYLNHTFLDLDLPYMTSRYSVFQDQLVGRCHGLIALMNDITTVLFNPSTRNYRLLPPSPFDCPQGLHQCIRSVGFGFDSVVNDYKFVRISEFLKDDRYGYIEEVDEKIEVYELGIDCWRELDHVDQGLPKLYWSPCSQMFYKGAFHWIDQDIILCFDISTEIFRNMNIPDTYHYYNDPFYSLIILNKSLTLICYPSILPVIDPTEDLIEIWIMKDYDVYESWIKKYTLRSLSMECPLAVWKDNFLLFQGNSGCLISYDLNSDEIKELNLHGCERSMRAVVYKESLASIPRGSENSTQVHKF